MYCFVIPAYNPTKTLLLLVETLLTKEPDVPIVVVNDGSDLQCREIFENLKNGNFKDRVTVLEHAINLGKGAALKTAFNFLLVKFKNLCGVVTLDSDGQHAVDDCLNILEVLRNNPDSFVLGYREFTKDIPLKSYIGNNISKLVYYLMLGKKIYDTQTGLRGIPRQLLIDCLTIEANRFEFETEQLILAINNNMNLIQVPIKTIYIDNNKHSSFRPIMDSFKIYFTLLRYAFSSIATYLFDIFLFSIFLKSHINLLLSNLFSRTGAITLQFFLLNKFVFKTNKGVKSFLLLYLYVIIMGIVSAWLQVGLIKTINCNPIFAKTVVELFLFFLNFAFLRSFLFHNKGE